MAEIKKIFQNRNNLLMIIILIIGIAIIVLPGMKPDVTKDTVEVADETRGEEERLSGILSQIDGAGRVSVMISYESTMEKEIAYDGDMERAVTSGGDVVVRREIYPGVKGVIVIADGAAEPSVRNAIKEAVIAVTGAAANHICVYSRSGK